MYDTGFPPCPVCSCHCGVAPDPHQDERRYEPHHPHLAVLTDCPVQQMEDLTSQSVDVVSEHKKGSTEHAIVRGCTLCILREDAECTPPHTTLVHTPIRCFYSLQYTVCPLSQNHGSSTDASMVILSHIPLFLM